MPPLELIPSRSFSQTLEELLNEEWPPEAEEEVRRIERLLLGPGAGPDPATPSTTSHPPSHPQYAVSSITSPPSSTQQMEDLLDLPWSDEEESIVRDIEARALLLTASAFPSQPSQSAYLGRTSTVVEDHEGSRQEQITAVTLRRPTPSLTNSHNSGRSPYHAPHYLHFLDLEAEQSGSTTSSGDEGDGPEDITDDGSMAAFITETSQCTQSELHWRGMLSQNVAGGPQFRDPPRRHYHLGGPRVLRRRRLSQFTDAASSQASIGTDDEYDIGSFVADDNESLAYESDSSRYD